MCFYHNIKKIFMLFLTTLFLTVSFLGFSNLPDDDTADCQNHVVGVHCGCKGSADGASGPNDKKEERPGSNGTNMAGDPIVLNRGSFWKVVTDINIPLNGDLNLLFKRYHMKDLRYAKQLLGPAWRCNLDARLFDDGTNKIFRDALYDPHVFELVSGTTDQWVSIFKENHNETLSYNSSTLEYVLEKTDGSKLVFNNNSTSSKAGYLIREEDKYGNIITIEWDTDYKKVLSVYSSVDDRSLEFTYITDGDYERISTITLMPDNVKYEYRYSYEFYVPENPNPNCSTHPYLQLNYVFYPEFTNEDGDIEKGGEYYYYGYYTDFQTSATMPVSPITDLRNNCIAEEGVVNIVIEDDVSTTTTFMKSRYKYNDLHTYLQDALVQSWNADGQSLHTLTNVSGSKYVLRYTNYHGEAITYTLNYPSRVVNKISYSTHTELNKYYDYVVDPDSSDDTFLMKNIRKGSSSSSPILEHFEYDINNTNHYERMNLLSHSVYTVAGDPSTSSTTFYTYEDNSTRIKTITDPRGKVTTYNYNEDGELTSIVDPENRTTSYEYDDYGNTTKVTSSDGRYVDYEFDEFGELTGEYPSSGPYKEYVYDSRGRLSTTSISDDVTSYTTTYTYDNLNRVTQTDYPSGQSVKYYYDYLNRVKKVVDPKDNEATFTYDIYGNVLTATDADDNVTTYSYSPAGELLSITDANNHTTSYDYDDLFRPITQTDALSNTTNIEYGGGTGGSCCGGTGSEITSLIDPKGNSIVSTYDDAGKIETITINDEREIAFNYDNYGAVTAMIDNALSPYFGSTAFSYQYDDYGKLVAETNPNGLVTSYAYDSLGRRESLTNPLDHATTYTYNQTTGHLDGITNAYDQTTSYTYDSFGRINEILNANDTYTTFSYNISNIAGVSNFASDDSVISSFTYDYDDNMNRTKATLNNGDYINYQYDVLNRLTREQKFNSSDATLYTFTYEYDGVGNRTQMEFFDGSTTSTTTYTYNELNQLTSRDEDSTEYTYEYDANGNLTECSGNGSIILYTYDSANKMIAVNNNGIETKFVYDASGRRLIRSDDSGLKTHYLYDGLNTLLELDAVRVDYGDDFERSDIGAGWSVESGVWELYDDSPNGKYLWAKENSSVITFHRRALYEGSGEFTEDPHISVKARPFADEMGNWHAFVVFYKDENYIGQAGCEFDALNNTFNWVITYKDYGEQKWSYQSESARNAGWIEFDVEMDETMITIKENGNDVLSADVGIQMVQGTTGLATFNKEAWFDDFNVEVSEYDGAKKSREYTLAPSAVGGIISSRDTTSLGTFADYWYQYDAIGNVANRTNGAGASVDAYVQDAFGNVLAGGQGDGYHLTTKQFDADAGLYYFNARWYDPLVGRFTQLDPMKDGINFYVYVDNNPVNFVDPTGLERGNPGQKCYEKGEFPIWYCTRKLNGKKLKLGFWSHSYWCCDGPNGNQCYGTQLGDDKGSIIRPEDNPSGNCTLHCVCLEKKTKSCSGTTKNEQPYFVFPYIPLITSWTDNCHKTAKDATGQIWNPGGYNIFGWL